MKLRYFLLCVFYILLAPLVFGQTSTIKINEILIEPTPQVVELINTGSEIVDLSSWYIDDGGGTTYFTIPSGTQLYPNACLSFSGNFNLNRTSTDTVRVYDSTAPPTSVTAHLIDSFEYKSSSGSGISFQRVPDGSPVWATGSSTLDLYNLTGLSCKFNPPTVAPTFIPTEAPTSIPTNSPTPTSITSPTLTSGSVTTPTIIQTPTLTPTPTSSPSPSPKPEIKAVYLSEVYPYPNTNEQEWLELFNDNEFEVVLDDWKIDDIANGGSSPKRIDITIPGYSFKVVDLTSSIFNNTGDDVRLLNSNGELVDSFSYGDVEKGKSVGRTSFLANNYCLQDSSKGFSNLACIKESIDEENEDELTPTPTKSPIDPLKPSSTKKPGEVLGSSDSNLLFSTNPDYHVPIQNDRSESVKSQGIKDIEDGGDTEQKINVAETTSLISAGTAFLTAVFLFIRIIL